MRRVDDPGEWDTPDAALRRFRPESAGLDPMTVAEADAHIAAYAAERPWLGPARDAPPDVRRIIASLVAGQGHTVERHEGGVTAEQLDRRVRRLEDPAIARDAERTPGIDAYKARTHACGDYATRIADKDAFAVCAARAVEHPRTRAVLDGPYDPARQQTPSTSPSPVCSGRRPTSTATDIGYNRSTDVWKLPESVVHLG